MTKFYNFRVYQNAKGERYQCNVTQLLTLGEDNPGRIKLRRQKLPGILHRHPRKSSHRIRLIERNTIPIKKVSWQIEFFNQKGREWGLTSSERSLDREFSNLTKPMMTATPTTSPITTPTMKPIYIAGFRKLQCPYFNLVHQIQFRELTRMRKDKVIYLFSKKSLLRKRI